MEIKGPFQNCFTVKFISITLGWIAVLICSLSVIFCQHQGRMLHANLQSLVKTEENLINEWSKLLLEHSTATTDSRVEKIAKKKLDMEIIKDVEVIKE